MELLIVFLLSFIISACLAVVLEKIAFKFKILDVPNEERRIHSQPTPLMGGLAVFVSVSLVLWLTKDHLFSGNLSVDNWLGVWLGAIIIMIGGLLDDKLNLSSKKQIIFPALAALAVIAGGVNIEKLGNPFGGYIYLAPAVSGILVFLWLMGMSYTTKILDGLDGLVSGVGTIGALIIFLFTMTTRWYQPDIAWAALVLAGATAGFLLRNWHPAKIFLGEAGSVFVGFALGVLSIISGGKLAVALLIMGIPILDIIWTIVRRLAKKQNPFKTADRQHLHFRLLDAGLKPRQAVTVFYVFSAIFGLAALFLQSKGKLLMLSFLIIIMLVALVFFYRLDKKIINR